MIEFDKNTAFIEYQTVEYAYLALLAYSAECDLELVMSKHVGEPKKVHYTIIGGDQDFYYTRWKDKLFVTAEDEDAYDKMKNYVG